MKNKQIHYSNNKKELDKNKHSFIIQEILLDIILVNKEDKEEKILQEILIKKELISLYIMY